MFSFSSWSISYTNVCGLAGENVILLKYRWLCFESCGYEREILRSRSPGQKGIPKWLNRIQHESAGSIIVNKINCLGLKRHMEKTKKLIYFLESVMCGKKALKPKDLGFAAWLMLCNIWQENQSTWITMFSYGNRSKNNKFVDLS